MEKLTNHNELTIPKTAIKKRQDSLENAISEDLLTIGEAIASDDEVQMMQAHITIDGKYTDCMPNLGQSMYCYVPKRGFNYQLMGKNSLKHNLALMKARLIGYRDFPHNAAEPTSQNNINVSVSSTNEISIELSIEQAKQRIDDMPGLTDGDTEEIKGKINELESISQEPLSKKKKWEKVKPILAFALDKGADVAITIMGLILQMKLGM